MPFDPHIAARALPLALLFASILGGATWGVDRLVAIRADRARAAQARAAERLRRLSRGAL